MRDLPQIIDYDKDQLSYALANAIKERDDAKSELASTKYWLTKERDDALSQIFQAECRAERFCQERDEAREEIKRLKEILDLIKKDLS